MPETVSAVVAEILAQGSFDLSSPEALAILNRRHKQMTTEARSYRSSDTATRPSPSTPFYTKPDGLLDLMWLYASSAGAVFNYSPGRRSDTQAITAGTIMLDPSDGRVFVEFAVGGVAGWYLYPDPDPDDVVAYGVYEPPTLLIDNSVPFQVDPDLVEGLMAGVFATALMRPGEARPDLAVQQEAIFTTAVQKFRVRAQSRFRGSGPAQIRIQGINA